MRNTPEQRLRKMHDSVNEWKIEFPRLSPVALFKQPNDLNELYFAPRKVIPRPGGEQCAKGCSSWGQSLSENWKASSPGAMLREVGSRTAKPPPPLPDRRANWREACRNHGKRTKTGALFFNRSKMKHFLTLFVLPAALPWSRHAPKCRDRMRWREWTTAACLAKRWIIFTLITLRSARWMFAFGGYKRLVWLSPG